MTIVESSTSVISRAAVRLSDQGGSQHLVDLLHNAACLSTTQTTSNSAPTLVGDAAHRFAREILNGQVNVPDHAAVTSEITVAYCMACVDEHLKLAVANCVDPTPHLEVAKLYLELADRAAFHCGQR